MIAVPDSQHVNDLYPSPNIEPRLRGLAPSLLILHYTGLLTLERSLDILSREDCKVSCHYVVDTGGRIIQMVAEEMRAWHAGQSSWRGETDINSASIGIEIQNAGHSHGSPDYPAEQMQAVIALCQDITLRHGIEARCVLGHSDVAPSRKIDPGEKFDWPGLAQRGVGFWVPPAPVDLNDSGWGLGDEHPDIAEAQRLFERFGYGITETGQFDEPMRFVVRAFQLHFRPGLISERLDRSTLDTARRLIEALPDELIA